MVRFSCVCKERDYSAGGLRVEVLADVGRRGYSHGEYGWLVGHMSSGTVASVNKYRKL